MYVFVSDLTNLIHDFCQPRLRSDLPKTEIEALCIGFLLWPVKEAVSAQQIGSKIPPRFTTTTALHCT